MYLYLNVLYILLVIAIFGYLFSVLKEKMTLNNNQVEIKSKVVDQDYIQKLDMKRFKIGRTELSIGDEIVVYLKTNTRIKGIILGAIKHGNLIVILTNEDHIRELPLKAIHKLKIISRYGKLL